MIPSSRCRALLFFLACSLAAGALAAQQLSQRALTEIGALMAEKETRTPAQRKMASSLVLAIRSVHEPRLSQAWPDLVSSLDFQADGAVEVDIKAEIDDQLESAIEAAGGRVLSSHPRFQALRAELPWQSLESIATRPQVRWIEPATAFMTQGANVTEGDVAHDGPSARVQFGVDGTGVTVGAMSDSVDSLADLVSSGDLPAGVTVLKGQSGNPGTSEGTALLEIVHDLAPGASLFFATGAGGEAQMAQNILDLAAAGCDIIVDDVTYFSEGVFQDDLIAQAVETVTEQGVLYVTSAGNSGNLAAGESGVFEADFLAATLPGSLSALGPSAHDYGGGDTFNEVTEPEGNTAPFFTLQWAEPLSGATSDYDLFLLDPSATKVLKASTNVQDGTQDPFEILDSRAEDDSGNLLLVVQDSGSPRFFHLNTHRGRLEHATDGQIFGHAGALSAITVGAIDVALAGGGPFTGGVGTPVEFFSSDGPRRIFFEADGTPTVASTPEKNLGSQPVVRRKPDTVAANRVSTNTPAFFFFAGTSASAPHIAGILALLQERSPGATRNSIFFNFLQTALDVGPAGRDNVSGDGIAMASAALEKAKPGVSLIADEPVETSEAGESTTISVVLDAAPTQDVEVDVATDDASEAQALPSTVTFTSANWDQAQSVGVFGVDDEVDDGNQVFQVTTGLTRSTDMNFVGLVADPLQGVNTDDDTAGVSTSEDSLETSETGTTDTFDVVLDSEPIFDVTLDVRSEDTTEGLVSDDGQGFSESISLTFTPSNFDQPQTVTVMGQDDDIFFTAVGDGDVTYRIVVSSIESQDPVYEALDLSKIFVTVVNRQRPFFADGFESGNLNGWSSSSP